MKHVTCLLTCLSLMILPSKMIAADDKPATPSTTNGAPAKITPYGYDYFKLRDGLDNCRIKFEREKKGRVAFLSTHDRPDPDNFMKGLKKRFPQTEFDTVIAWKVSTGSTDHAFRFPRYVLRNGPVDLLVIETVFNDSSVQKAQEILRGTEGVVRQARISNPNMDIMIVYWARDNHVREINAGKVPMITEWQEKVADAYGVPSVDIGKEFAERNRAGEFTWGGTFTNGFLGPLFGFTQPTIDRMLNAAWQKPLPEPASLKACKLPEKPLDEKSYFHGRLLDVKQATLGEGWSLVKNPAYEEGCFKPHEQEILVADKPGSTLRLKFDGTAIGFYVEMRDRNLAVEFSIDGGAFAKQSLSGGAWGNLLSTELAPGPHELVLRLAEATKPAKPDAKVPALRIVYFMAN